MRDLSGGTKHVPQEYFVLRAVSLGVLHSGDRQKFVRFCCRYRLAGGIGGEARRNVLE
jgi:hypothetical protein